MPSTTPQPKPPSDSSNDNSDLALISKMSQSTSPKSPAPPPIPPKISPEAHRRLAAKTAEKRASLAKPYVLAPEVQAPSPKSPTRAPRALLKMEIVTPQSSAFGIDTPENSPKIKLSKSPTASFDTPSSSLNKLNLTRQRAATILRKARESMVLGGIIGPETDSDDDEEEERKYVMSGGLLGDDLSERELSGRPPRKARVSKFSEDFGEADGTLVQNPVAGEQNREDERRIKKGCRRSPRSSEKVVKTERTSAEASGRGAKEKETVLLTRTHERRSARTTIGDDGYVVCSERDTEYYESVGPVGGCIVG